MSSKEEASRQIEAYIQGVKGYILTGKIGEDRMERAKPIAIELLHELAGKTPDYQILDTSFKKSDVTAQTEVDLKTMTDTYALDVFSQVVFLRILGITRRPDMGYKLSSLVSEKDKGLVPYSALPVGKGKIPPQDLYQRTIDAMFEETIAGFRRARAFHQYTWQYQAEFAG